MAELPFMPLDTGAYISDTLHLSPAQHGAYLMMIIVAWRSPNCMLPMDDVYLARVTGLGIRTWRKNKDTLLAFWKVSDDGKLYQPKMIERYKFVSDKRISAMHAGKASALKRNNTGSTVVEIPLALPLNEDNIREERDITSDNKLSSDKSLSLSHAKEKQNSGIIDLDLLKGKSTTLPEYAPLKHDWGAWAEGKGLDGAAICDRWEAFRTHHLTAGTKSSNWFATWQSWVNKFIAIKKEQRA